VLQTFTGHSYGVSSVAFSPDGTKVLTGAGDNTAKLWDAATGTVLQTFTGHSYGVSSVAFSPDGTKVLTGADWRAILWDAATGAVLQTFSRMATFVRSVAFSPDGMNVLTGSADSTANLWDAATGSLTVTILPQAAVNAGARWRLDTGPWCSSGYTLTVMSTGQHTVVFSPVLGYDTPDPQIVEIDSGAHLELTGAYDYVGGVPAPHGVALILPLGIVMWLSLRRIRVQIRRE
jgi:WD40 repeat protein